MEDYSNQNGHSGYDPKYNPQSYGPNYDYGSYGNDPYGEGGPNKSVKGLKIMIVIMALILAALSAIYFLQVKQMKDDFAIERDTLTRQLTSLMNDYDTLKTMNDTLAVHYEGVKHQADSLLDKLQKERRLSYSKIRNYEKQMSYMSKSDREVSRASRAERLRVDLVLVGNELAEPGERTVYVQIIGPDGYVLANASNALFDFEGDKITFSAARQVDYQNNDLSVSLFYNGSGITSGKYRVKIYTDGNLIGSNEIILR